MKEKPLILNIESATGHCSICLSKGEDIVTLQVAQEVYQHSKVLTSLIESAFAESSLDIGQLDAVAISSGPGSYTSLRVGASTAKGICFALNKPLLKIDTLRSIALAARQEFLGEGFIYCPMIDARRMEAYFSLYDEAGRSLVGITAGGIKQSLFDKHLDLGQKIVFTGNGSEKFKNIFPGKNVLFRPLDCSASFMPILSSTLYDERKFEDVAYFTPLYFKQPNITISKKRTL